MDRNVYKNDLAWMRRAFEEAAKGGWAVHPNPMVGAVIVKDGREIGCGYHHEAGKPHAEIEALRDAAARGEDVRGATIYVTLEPCNHYGKTPPCTEALIEAGIRRCIIGTVDTDERVRGSGIARLKQAGLDVNVGFLVDELYELNAAFFKRTSTGLPYVTAKWAMSLDGHIATRTRDSRWVTGEAARQDVHKARSAHDAIMVGTQTVIDDNPHLNVRLDGKWRQPLRVILDRTRRIPLGSRVFDTSFQKTVLFTAKDGEFATKTKVEDYTFEGVCVEFVPVIDGSLSLIHILKTLVSWYGVTTLYVEGGSKLHGSLFDQHLVDAIDVYVAPKIIGGNEAPIAVAGCGVDRMNLATIANFEQPVLLGNDIRLRGRIKKT